MRILHVLIAVTVAAVCLAEPCGTPVHDWQAGDMGAVFTDGDRFFFGLGSALGEAAVDQNAASFDVVGFSRPFPETPFHAVVNGSQAIVGAGSVQVLDLGPAGNPVTTFEIRPPGWVIGLRSAGSLAAAYWWTSDFVSSWDEGVMIIDLSDPSQPELVGEIDTPGSEGKIQMTPDSFLYLYQERLWVYDLSRPEAPELVAESDRQGWNDLLAAEGDLVIARSSDGRLLFVDFADPVSPEVVATYRPAGGVNSIEWVADTLIMVIDGGYGNDDSLEIVDVSSATPTRISSSEAFFEGSIDEYSDSISCSSRFCMAVEGDYWTLPGLRLVDIRDPASPVLGDSVSFPSDVVDLGASGPAVAAADRDGRLWLVELEPDGTVDERLVAGVEASRVDAQGSHAFTSTVFTRDLDDRFFYLQVVDVEAGAEPTGGSPSPTINATRTGWISSTYPTRPDRSWRAPSASPLARTRLHRPVIAWSSPTATTDSGSST